MGKDNSNLSKGLLIGFLTGSIVGAAVALLYAPKSGKELRADIKGKSEELADEAEKFFETSKMRANQVINEGKKKAELLIADAKKKAEELIDDTEKILKDARSKASDMLETGKETLANETGKVKAAVKAGVEAYKEAKN